MRDAFRGYYRPTDEEFAKLWKECLFVRSFRIECG